MNSIKQKAAAQYRALLIEAVETSREPDSESLPALLAVLGLNLEQVEQDLAELCGQRHHCLKVADARRQSREADEDEKNFLALVAKRNELGQRYIGELNAMDRELDALKLKYQQARVYASRFDRYSETGWENTPLSCDSQQPRHAVAFMAQH